GIGPPRHHDARERDRDVDRPASDLIPRGVAMSTVTRLAARRAEQADVDLPNLERSLRHPRALFSFAMSWLTGIVPIFTLVPLVPVFSVLYLLGVRGGQRLSSEILFELPPAAMMPGGGFGNAILGTLLMVAIATFISVPIGILAAVFVADLAPESRTATAVRF